MPSKSSFHLAPISTPPILPLRMATQPTAVKILIAEICCSTHQCRRKNEICGTLDGMIGLTVDDGVARTLNTNQGLYDFLK